MTVQYVTLAERIASQRQKELDIQAAVAEAKKAKTAENQSAAEQRLRQLLLEQLGIESDSTVGMVTIPKITRNWGAITEGGTYAALEVEGFLFVMDHLFKSERYKSYLGILTRCPNGHFDPPNPKQLTQPDEFDRRLKEVSDKQQELAATCNACIDEKKLASVSERLVNAIFCAGYVEAERFVHALMNIVPEFQQQKLLALLEGVSE